MSKTGKEWTRLPVTVPSSWTYVKREPDPEPQFKVGDVIQCRNASASDSRLTEGQNYRVEALDGNRVILEDVKCRLEPHSWLEERFKLEWREEVLQ